MTTDLCQQINPLLAFSLGFGWGCIVGGILVWAIKHPIKTTR